jgi:hypothetical protein
MDDFVCRRWRGFSACHGLIVLYFSKDLILELIMISRVNVILFLVAILATFFTVAYSLYLNELIRNEFTKKFLYLASWL